MMKVWVQDISQDGVRCTRIDDPYLMQFTFTAKSFIEPMSADALEAGVCYRFIQREQYKIIDAQELSEDDSDVQAFFALVSGLERLPHEGFVIDYLRDEADKLAFVKLRDPRTKDKLFWQRKREYWPWYLRKRVTEAAAL